MVNTDVGLQVSKPVSVWNKPLNADFKKLFKSLTKAVGHSVTGNWVKLSEDAVDAATSVGFEKDPGQLAWLLIYRSITRAVFELVSKNVDLLSKNQTEVPDDVFDKIDLTFETNQVSVDQKFFERPQDFPLLEYIKVPLREWLLLYAMGERRVETVLARLPSFFVFALNEEWRLNQKRYAPIRDALDTPFTKATEVEQAWTRYTAWLQMQVDESLFNETFSLRQVYVRLRAFKTLKLQKKTSLDVGLRDADQEEKAKYQVVELEGELDSWLNKADKTDAIRVVSGGPGSGKSSFARMYAARLALEGRSLLLIPMHQYDPSEDLEQAVGDYVRNTGVLPVNPLDPDKGEPELLIIFDGLDELAMQGKAAFETVQEFVREVQRTVDRRNLQTLRIQVILSGRTLVIQANESAFRKPGQILNVLPYVLTKDEQKRYDDPGNLLDQDQRNEWWRKYSSVTDGEAKGLPEELKRKDLDEITAQPLLNYLIALSYSRKTLDFTKEMNRNLVYADLIQAVYERAYEGRPYPATMDLKVDEFVRILEEIGLTTWHGDGRKTTVRAISEHCTSSGLTNLIEKFQKGAETGVARLLTAFYFRQFGTSTEGEKTFEFTHKSFGEFLTAKRIGRALGRINRELKSRSDDPDSGWDMREALVHWIETCGRTEMDLDLFRFVSDEIKLQERDTITALQKMLCECISFMLRHGMPFERVEDRPSYMEEVRQSRNAEESLLASLSACASVTGEMSKIRWPQPTSAGEWINRLRNQRSSGGNVLALKCLQHIGFCGSLLYLIDLYGADLNSSDLSNAGLTFAVLHGANLECADLRAAHLRGAKLEAVNLERANLLGANLLGANLDRANLKGANLERANLRHANLEGADLEGANLEGANLEGANLEGANLQGTILDKKDVGDS